jgi:hypothetical protein
MCKGGCCQQLCRLQLLLLLLLLLECPQAVCLLNNPLLLHLLPLCLQPGHVVLLQLCQCSLLCGTYCSPCFGLGSQRNLEQRLLLLNRLHFDCLGLGLGAIAGVGVGVGVSVGDIVGVRDASRWWCGLLTLLVSRWWCGRCSGGWRCGSW